MQVCKDIWEKTKQKSGSSGTARVFCFQEEMNMWGRNFSIGEGVPNHTKDYQKAVVCGPDWSPPDLLCGLAQQDIVVKRVRALCGLVVDPAPATAVGDLRFRKGVAVRITERSCAREVLRRRTSPLVSRPALVGSSRLTTGRRVRPIRKRVAARGGKLSVAIRRSSLNAEAMLRLDA